MKPLRSHTRGSSLAVATAFLLTLATAAAAQTTAIGLSAVRAQRFGNENLLGFYTPQGGDVFALALAAGDFNGDGADDLATGIPYDNGIVGSDIKDSGTVVVRYGIPAAGLATNLASTVLRQTPALDPPEVGDQYGESLAACNFNGDAFDDLAVGVPYEDHLGESDAGAIQIHYGTSSGLPFRGDAFYAESTPGIPGDVESSDNFGWTLACGDFNADGFGDLVVGVPHESWGSIFTYHVWYGMIVIIPGSALGLVPAQARSLDQDSPGMASDPEDDDLFGEALAAGDFNADGFDDLAIGVPGEESWKGVLQVVFGSTSGLTGSGSQLLSESSIGGQSAAFDAFTSALATGDFDHDGFEDLAITAGADLDIITMDDAVGRVDVLYGAVNGFDRGRTQFWDQDAILGTGTNEPHDNFGFAMAVDDFDKDGFTDLAIGHWGEAISGPEDGSVTVLMGSSPFGLTAARHRSIAPGIEGFPGNVALHGKRFGYALTHGDFDGDGHADLAIGSPWEDQDGLADVGAETVLYGALFADGAETGNTNLWSQNVSSLYRNKTQVAPAARLGPLTSKVGLEVDLFAPSIQLPVTPTYVRVGPEAGFHDEHALQGTFFVDPQNLTMSTTPGRNSFQMVAFNDGVGPGSRTRLTFLLVRTADQWFINVFHFNEALGTFQFSGGGFFACAAAPCGNPADFHNTRIDYAWTAGNPGHLTMWRTRYVGGVPDANGKIQMFSVDLPDMSGAVINHAFAGMFTGQATGTSGKLFLDELSFRR
ncbi:MAG TPA: FG-GAP repeat protein [Thermoanaerobaculia bacterium]|jgi:hypothetical protein|nr:FG-GAP repeat protein [Thermoanaerobaculia bacterium]